MLTTLLLLSSLFFCGSKADLQDFDDEEFAAFVKFHDDLRKQAQPYAEIAGRGCVKGAAVGALTGKGIPGLCIGCVVNGAGDLISEFAFPRNTPSR